MTNWHVAVDDSDSDDPPSPVIRLNTKFGTTVTIDLKPEQWTYMVGGPDIAVYPLEIDQKDLEFSYAPTDMFAQERDIEAGDVAVGDDVFVAGLFFDHSGEEANVPSSSSAILAYCRHRLLQFRNIRVRT